MKPHQLNRFQPRCVATPLPVCTYPVRCCCRDIYHHVSGLIDAGEDLPEAAAREVLEETGVETEFDSVLAFRHGHRGLFGKSDLFFVVRMRLKPGVDGSALQPQASAFGQIRVCCEQLLGATFYARPLGSRIDSSCSQPMTPSFLNDARQGS